MRPLWTFFLIVSSLAPGLSAQGEEPLTLDQAVAIAMEWNPRILTAEQEVAASQVRTLPLEAFPDPTLVLSDEGLSFRRGGAEGTKEYSFGVEQSFEFPAKRAFRGRDLGRFVAEARRLVRQDVALPPGYYLAWGRQFENQQRAMRRLGIILPTTVALIVLLLFLTFSSLRLSLLVLANLPFALIGRILSLYVSGLYLSVPASVGFIALFGIAVLNGIVLLSYIAQLREGGGRSPKRSRRGARTGSDRC